MNEIYEKDKYTPGEEIVFFRPKSNLEIPAAEFMSSQQGEKEEDFKNNAEKAGTTTNYMAGFVAGAFGDMEDCEGLLEKVITPKEGGTYMKFYGCDYLFKSFPVSEVVENLGLAKALISFVPREVIAKSFLFSVATILLFIFQRKKFLYLANLWIGMIYDRTVVKAGMPPERYNQFSVEFKRAANAAILNQAVGIELTKPLDKHDAVESVKAKRLPYLVLIAKTVGFVAFVLELDTAYRFRFQDALENVDKENAKKDVIGEVRRIVNLMIERERDDSVRKKIVHIGRILFPVLRMSNMMRRLAREFLIGLDMDKIKLDDADWYFCLRRRGYDFRGVPLEKRLEEKKRIDKERNHLVLNFVYQQTNAKG